MTPAPTSFGWSDTPEALTAVLLRVAKVSGVYVDYRTQTRIPKDSTRWYSELIAAQTVRAVAPASTPRRLVPTGSLPAPTPTPVA